MAVYHWRRGWDSWDTLHSGATQGSDRQSLLKSNGDNWEETCRTLGLEMNITHWSSIPQRGREGWASSLDAGMQVLLSLRVRQENWDKQDLPRGKFYSHPQISWSLWWTECIQSNNKAQTHARTDQMDLSPHMNGLAEQAHRSPFLYTFGILSKLTIGGKQKIWCISKTHGQ